MIADARLQVSAAELVHFTRQLATLIHSGVPLKRSLGCFLDSPSALSEICADLSIQLERGESLTAALERYPRVFSAVYRGLVEIGERSASLHLALERLADMLERDLRNRQRLQAALSYPAMLVVVSAVSVAVFFCFVLPTMAPMYGAPERLPLPTQLLLWIGDSLRQPVAYLTLLGTVLVGWLCFWSGREWLQDHPEDRQRWHRFLLRVPVFGSLWHKLILARVFHGLAATLESGMALVHALAAVARVTGNMEVTARLRHTRDSLLDGLDVEEALLLSEAFPPTALALVNSASHASTEVLARLMRQLGRVLDDEVDCALHQAIQLIEPLLLLAMGSLMAFLIVASVLPMASMIDAL